VLFVNKIPKFSESCFLVANPAIHCKLLNKIPFLYKAKRASCGRFFTSTKNVLLFKRLSITIWAKKKENLKL
jgi:hypothetical protein